MKVGVGGINIGEKERAQVLEALDSSRISMGKKTADFERKFSAYIGAKQGISVSSGAFADQIAIESLIYSKRIQKGDEIAIPALAFIAVANSVLHAGCKPLFTDVDEQYFSMDLNDLQEKLTKKTKAILAVHNFGIPHDMDELTKFARDNKLSLIEDAAEAHGAEWKGKKIGSFGALSCFSFYVAHIITSGEGGMILTDDKELAEISRSLRAHGRACNCPTCVLLTSPEACPIRFTKGNEDKRFLFLYPGHSAKMNDLEAAIGLAQLENIEEVVKKRRENVDYLNSRLKKFSKQLQLPKERENGKNSYLCYPIITRGNASKFQFIQHLEKLGIETRPLFGSVPTQQPAFSFMGHKLGDFPVSERVSNNGFYIGCHQYLERAQLDYVADAFTSFLEKK
ncbi:MAG: DegT/DnrJ/EryC1/StrS family aminotransferase [Candidatus Micrarchaeota archaeon]